MEVILAETDEHLEEILRLQKENHIALISSDNKSDGFVTVIHDLPVLQLMNSLNKQVIALENGQVIGYALVMPKELKDSIPILVPMFDMFEVIPFKGRQLSTWNYYVMGQVCIAQSHRGKGIFEQLYLKHKETYSKQYDLCITEVSTSNPRSMRAHEKVGFRTIHTFEDKSDQWNILTWDWT